MDFTKPIPANVFNLSLRKYPSNAKWSRTSTWDVQFRTVCFMSDMNDSPETL